MKSPALAAASVGGGRGSACVAAEWIVVSPALQWSGLTENGAEFDDRQR